MLINNSKLTKDTEWKSVASLTNINHFKILINSNKLNKDTLWKACFEVYKSFKNANRSKFKIVYGKPT